MDELRREVTEGVLRMIASVVLHNHAVAQELGLGASDSQFLTLLDVHGPLTPGRLAALTGLSTGTVTGVVDRLERAGFVERVRDAGDRRRVLVTPAEGAGAVLAPHYREQAEHLDAVLARRDDDELRVIAAFLAELAPR
ncbi:MarR family winged helix-turn-helix transcriptional regulator [Pseudonocardia broussonetiae]|nr:MarR family transcriptional regulator [Pseudonocardia broussonetiae]